MLSMLVGGLMQLINLLKRFRKKFSSGILAVMIVSWE